MSTEEKNNFVETSQSKTKTHSKKNLMAFSKTIKLQQF